LGAALTAAAFTAALALGSGLADFAAALTGFADFLAGDALDAAAFAAGFLTGLAGFFEEAFVTRALP
jgi:hypothetical protein